MVKRCPICNRQLDALIPYNCKRCGLLYCNKHRLPENHHCSGLSHKGNIKDWINEEHKFKDQPEEKQSTEEIRIKHSNQTRHDKQRENKRDRRYKSYGSKKSYSLSSKIKYRLRELRRKFRRKRHFRTGTSGRIILALFVPLIVGLATIYFLEPGLSLLFQITSSENALLWLLIFLIIPAEVNSYVPWIAWIASGFVGGLISGRVLIPFISMYVLSWALLFVVGGETINQSFAMFGGIGMNQILFQMLAINFLYSIFAFGFGGWIGASIGGR